VRSATSFRRARDPLEPHPMFNSPIAPLPSLHFGDAEIHHASGKDAPWQTHPDVRLACASRAGSVRVGGIIEGTAPGIGGRSKSRRSACHFPMSAHQCEPLWPVTPVVPLGGPRLGFGWELLPPKHLGRQAGRNGRLNCRGVWRNRGCGFTNVAHFFHNCGMSRKSLRHSSSHGGEPT
jgi:hypothetical protein